MYRGQVRRSGLGEDLTTDQEAQRAMHDLAVRIVAARERGDKVEEARLRAELDRIGRIFSGYAKAAERAEVAEEKEGFDPLGLKALATSVKVGGVGVTALGLGVLALLFLFPLLKGVKR